MSVQHKCKQCNRKIKLIDTIMCRCKCNNLFCKIHRIDHVCPFDYQEDYRQSNNLVKLEEKKIDKI